MDSKNLFNSLVTNALDFLSQSIKELKCHPKYSTIHFYTAIELFLKARLMSEHWSLVVAKRQDPDWEDFIAGKFQSVTLDDAASRLEKIVRSGLSSQELYVFRHIRTHRNKAVHFFHEAHSAEVNNDLLRTIVKEQLTAWYYLYRLLTTRWGDVFEKWITKVAELDKEVRKHHDFLQVIFDQIKPKLEQLEKKGFKISECPSCEFKSEAHSANSNEFYESRCHVCDLYMTCIEIDCPECKTPARFREAGFIACPTCDKSLEPDSIVDALMGTIDVHIAVQGGGDEFVANCSDCMGCCTVVPSGNSYVCASCFSKFDDLETCDWCNELNTGNMEDSYITGCSICEGRGGWDG